MKEYIERGITYKQYLALIDTLLAEGKTTGPKQSPAMLNYGQINRQRMRRVEKTVQISDDFKNRLHGVSRRMIWLVLTEGWCGDAAQSVPIIDMIASESENIEAKYLLRDENLELMDEFLTSGGRAIPKVIILDAETHEVIGSWGSRPDAAQEYYLKMKAEAIEKSQISENIQRWYNQDKGHSILKEFAVLIDELDIQSFRASGV